MEWSSALDYGVDWLMVFSSTQLVPWLIHYRYFVLFPIVVVEGPIVTVIAGFLSSSGHLNVFVAYGVVVLGDLAGDSIYYAAGRWGKEGFLKRWGRFIGITMERIKQLQEYFAKHKGRTLILGKLSYGVGAPVLVAAGVADVPYCEFVGFNFIATLPKSLVLLLIGYYGGQGFAKISRYLDYTALGMLALAVLFTILYLMMKRIARRLSKKK